MEKVYGASHCSLHVRRSSKYAIALHKDTLGFEVAKIEKSIVGNFGIYAC